MVGKHGSAFGAGRRPREQFRQAVTEKDVIAKNKGRAAAPNEIGSNDESLRETFGPRLNGIGQRNSPLPTVAEQFPEKRKIIRRRDHQNIPDARQHQRGQRVIDHRLVVDRQQLLGAHGRHGIEPCTAAACQHNSFQDPLQRLGSRLEEPPETVCEGKLQRRQPYIKDLRQPIATKSRIAAAAVPRSDSLRSKWLRPRRGRRRFSAPHRRSFAQIGTR